MREIARLLRIEDKLDNRATQLSGGEMQRVAIGRALVREPAIYLMDEPLSSLDAKLRAELRLELKRIQRELGATILYVTHDQIEAMTMADRIGVIDDGRLVQIGTPREIYESPRNAYVATRLGSPAINLLPRGLFRTCRRRPAPRRIGARTEHLRIAQGDATASRASARVDWVEHLGDQNHLHVALGDRKLVTLSRSRSPVCERRRCRDRAASRRSYFDADGRADRRAAWRTRIRSTQTRSASLIEAVAEHDRATPTS